MTTKQKFLGFLLLMTVATGIGYSCSDGSNSQTTAAPSQAEPVTTTAAAIEQPTQAKLDHSNMNPCEYGTVILDKARPLIKQLIAKAKQFQGDHRKFAEWRVFHWNPEFEATRVYLDFPATVPATRINDIDTVIWNDFFFRSQQAANDLYSGIRDHDLELSNSLKLQFKLMTEAKERFNQECES